MQNEILTIIFGASPVAEVRWAIPFGIFVFKFSWLKAYWLGVLGNLLPIIPVLFFLHKFSAWLMHRNYFFNRFFTWLFERTRRVHENHFQKYNWKALALFVFVAIPLPLTGAYSGTVAAFIFGMPFWRSVLAISLGALAAGAIVLGLIYLGWIALLSFPLPL